MRAVNYVLGGAIVALAIAVSITLLVRNFPAGSPLSRPHEIAATGKDSPDARSSPEQSVAPPQAAAPGQRTKPGDLFSLEALPSPGYVGPGKFETPPRATAQSRGPSEGGRLNLTAGQSARIRYVLLSHTIMQSDAPEFPLRIGGAVPQEVSLTPLPRDVADAIPGYLNYSYVIAQYQIVIVVTERREIDLLIPTG